ncbi:transcriptional regulator [Brevibacillus humidisoli]|uniref:BTAD domain-containing putative transcriptional regulator n=1 Tax=Brevibacillus humidisoli TaxID=2895522 RepID=UPI001E6069CA|nr:BTAD domain-containing putative transcriptional regulator [Brevibacillus humidisoli]UFJ42549.1 transcriptional regulator [Brevibacillus humidisoli]
MMHHAIVKTKLMPPALPKTAIWRPRLMKQLRRLVDHRITLVFAEVGYGKSTALSAFFRDRRLPVCWYTIGPEERDLSLFVSYLIHAVESQFPSFATAKLEWPDPSGGERTKDELHRLCAWLVNVLCTRNEQFAILLDDYHWVEHDGPVDRFVQCLAAHLPEHVHLVIVTRTYPGWEKMSTYKLKNQLLEIGYEQLAFDREEIQLLLDGDDVITLYPDAVEQVYRQTEGWVLAADAMRQQWKRQRHGVSIREGEETFDDLFHSLRSEVWQGQPQEICRFLLETSVLEWMSGTLCDELCDWGVGEQLLAYIRRQGLFVRSIDRDKYCYHPLFRLFLQRQSSCGIASTTNAHRRAAYFFWQQQEYLQSIVHFMAIDDYDAVSKQFRSHSQIILAVEDIERLQLLMQQIPPAVKDRHYHLWISEGDLYRRRNQYEQAIACYARGERLAEQAGIPLADNAGLERKAQIFLDTIEPNKAEQVLKQVLAADANGESEVASSKVELYQLIAENLLNSGKSLDAERWYRRCQLLQTDFSDEQLEARLYLRTGRLEQARRLLEQKWRRESRECVRLRSQTHRDTTVLLSFVESLMGNPENARQMAESAIAQGMSAQTPYLEACGWMRKGHAMQLLPGYVSELSHICYRTALECMEAIHFRRGKAEPLMGLCLLLGRSGQTQQAVAYGRRALEETERADDRWLSAWIRLSIGIAVLYGRHWAEASRLLAQCRDDFQACGDSFGVTVSLLWQSLLTYHAEPDRFEDVMTGFLEMVDEGGYYFLLTGRTLFGPRDVRQLVPLLLVAHQKLLQAEVSSMLITNLHLRDVSYHPGHSLEVASLGTFHVQLGDKEVAERDWHRGKAKELFQLLITCRERFLPKEEIISLLWGSADEKAANRDFKVALHALNAALEPNRQAWSPPFFIDRQGSLYRLHPASGLTLDAADFERWIRQGLGTDDAEQAEDLLHTGLRLYKGDYLPDRRYTDWCREERERLRLLFLKGAERLAAICLSRGAYDQAIYWCEQIIRKDPCWEEAYQMLMKAHDAAHNRHQAIKWYQRLCEVLKTEFGVEPMHATQRIYHNITR